MIWNASSSLSPKNALYRRALLSHVWENYRQDAARGDLTTGLFEGRRHKRAAEVTAKKAGIVAGVAEAAWFLKRCDLSVRFLKKDGDKIKKGDVLARLEGKAEKILKAERTLLNLLQRLSGIATLTNDWVRRAPKGVSVLPTRKTAWGLLEKRAVALGGGGTHRLNLEDAILIKDNHWALGGDMGSVLKKALQNAQARFTEIEVDSERQAARVLQWATENRPPKTFAVMLDNFSPAAVKNWAPRFAALKIPVEVSGGVTLKRLKKMTPPGVSAVSGSALTMAAPPLDLSLHFCKT